MYYTGIDLHKKTCFISTVDEDGKIVHKAHLENMEGSILSYFRVLEGESKIVIESMASWYWLYDLLTEHGFKVVISNPIKTKAIASAKIKNDKVDSHMPSPAVKSRVDLHGLCERGKDPPTQRVAKAPAKAGSGYYPNEKSNSHPPDEE